MLADYSLQVDRVCERGTSCKRIYYTKARGCALTVFVATSGGVVMDMMYATPYDLRSYRSPYEDGSPSEKIEVGEYSDFLQQMDYLGIWVPKFGEVYYVPLIDDVDCWEERWHGYLDEQEWCREGLVFKTANEAVAKARKDLEVALGHV